ncbi:GlsB/YeaQ/YmgE family stress response membrane protein [Novosphingobium sp. G106]|uniref:GlsB/YeaQ/YmgE family stress response membrane protein n=1 Tax=Novosphingobium sp. G106 TaxID=2849500 RepID=UPI001C2DAA13|nr:GlsB/YeaQ/YmgE family stress response membrane protein [Novosphingobium sp. G106]MBV1691532.1 GlsB/YeaQ/YmgE family stress response membrane protein [Novosphingobium sp. G106]
MSLLIILLVGMLVGWLASVVTGTGGGFIFDMVVGILGALVAGWLFGGGASFLTGAITLMSVVYSVVGAIILLLIVGLVRGRRWV